MTQFSWERGRERERNKGASSVRQFVRQRERERLREREHFKSRHCRRTAETKDGISRRRKKLHDKKNSLHFPISDFRPENRLFID